MVELAGKVALVTGGSRGIGAAIARRLASDGADVAITYSASGDRAGEVVHDIEAMGRAALAIRADNLETEAMERAVALTVERLGRIDILVNNAGVFHAGPLEQFTYEDFEKTIAINVRAPFLAARTAADRMGEGGRIVSIGSSFAVRVPSQGLSLYALSKAALVGMTKGMARDLGPKGITVNIVHPGSTDTEMNPADAPDAGDQLAGMAIPGFSDPTEIASLVAWLAGSDASRVTGAEFTVDGGSNA